MYVLPNSPSKLLGEKFNINFRFPSLTILCSFYVIEIIRGYGNTNQRCSQVGWSTQRSTLKAQWVFSVGFIFFSTWSWYNSSSIVPSQIFVIRINKIIFKENCFSTCVVSKLRVLTSIQYMNYVIIPCAWGMFDPVPFILLPDTTP